MNITNKELGERLKQFRNKLGLRQGDVADKLGVNQNMISRIEKGIGGTIETLLSLINYYSQFFVVDHIFSNNFTVIEIGLTPSHLDSVAIERLKLLQEDLNKDIAKIIVLLESQ